MSVSHEERCCPPKLEQHKDASQAASGKQYHICIRSAMQFLQFSFCSLVICVACVSGRVQVAPRPRDTPRIISSSRQIERRGSRLHHCARCFLQVRFSTGGTVAEIPVRASTLAKLLARPSLARAVPPEPVRTRPWPRQDHREGHRGSLHGSIISLASTRW